MWCCRKGPLYLCLMAQKQKKVGDFFEDWQILRQHKIKYFLIRSTLLYGLPVWVIVLLITWAFDIQLYREYSIVYLIVFCLAGFGYTWLEWKYNERKFRKMGGERGGSRQ